LETSFSSYIPLKMGAVNKRLEVTSPPVLGMQGLPVCTERSKYAFIPNYLAILKEVQVNGTAFQVNGVHGLRPTCFEVQSLLLGSPRQLTASDFEALVGCVLNQFASIQQECGLFVR
jgi:hypothetical protein